jgi:hypothetical protein
MKRRSPELSTFAILGISGSIATVGLLGYLLLTPVTPSQRIALAFSAINQPITR